MVRRRAGGFSLLEMMVAATVLAVGLVIVTECISSGLTAGARAERRLTASQLAADRLNRAAAGVAASAHASTVRIAGLDYHWEIRESTDAKSLRKLRCIVRWRSRGERRMVSLDRSLPSAPAGPSAP